MSTLISHDPIVDLSHIDYISELIIENATEVKSFVKIIN